MEDAHHQYGVGYAVFTYHIISMDGVCSTGLPKAVDGCIYLGKMIFYRQYYHNPDFILLWLNPNVAETTLGC